MATGIDFWIFSPAADHCRLSTHRPCSQTLLPAAVCRWLPTTFKSGGSVVDEGTASGVDGTMAGREAASCSWVAGRTWHSATSSVPLLGCSKVGMISRYAAPIGTVTK
jgi:hypothetical protein